MQYNRLPICEAPGQAFLMSEIEILKPLISLKNTKPATIHQQAEKVICNFQQIKIRSSHQTSKLIHSDSDFNAIQLCSTRIDRQSRQKFTFWQEGVVRFLVFS